MAGYDCVVIGAGHNGLTLAAYLSRAGLSVGVIERNGKLGGGTSTEEPTLPGYRFNLHSNFFMGFRHAPLMHDLELWRFGYSYVEPLVQQAAAFRDGTCVVIHKDLDATCRSLARFSKRDAETFHDLHELYGRKMRPLLRSLLYNAPLPVDQLRDRCRGRRARSFSPMRSTTCSAWCASTSTMIASAPCSPPTCTSSRRRASRAPGSCSRRSFPT